MAAIDGRVPESPLVTASFSTKEVRQKLHTVHLAFGNRLYFRQNTLKVRYRDAGNARGFSLHDGTSRRSGCTGLAERPQALHP